MHPSTAMSMRNVGAGGSAPSADAPMPPRVSGGVRHTRCGGRHNVSRRRDGGASHRDGCLQLSGTVTVLQKGLEVGAVPGVLRHILHTALELLLLIRLLRRCRRCRRRLPRRGAAGLLRARRHGCCRCQAARAGGARAGGGKLRQRTQLPLLPLLTCQLFQRGAQAALQQYKAGCSSEGSACASTATYDARY